TAVSTALRKETTNCSGRARLGFRGQRITTIPAASWGGKRTTSANSRSSVIRQRPRSIRDRRPHVVGRQAWILFQQFVNGHTVGQEIEDERHPDSRAATHRLTEAD